MSITVDHSKFDAAFRLYLAKTSKTMQEAINWKASDLMMTAAGQTPKTKLTDAQFHAQQTNPKIIGAAAKKIYDRRGGMWGQVYAETRDAMSRRRLGRAFMRSAWIKASNKIPRTLKGKMISGDAQAAATMTRSRADVRISAGDRVRELFAAMYWDAKNDKDRGQKQAMVDAALAYALPIQTAKMMQYVTGENRKNAKSVSA